jgi:hypothetical protein
LRKKRGGTARPLKTASRSISCHTHTPPYTHHPYTHTNEALAVKRTHTPYTHTHNEAVAVTHSLPPHTSRPLMPTTTMQHYTCTHGATGHTFRTHTPYTHTDIHKRLQTHTQNTHTNTPHTHTQTMGPGHYHHPSLRQDTY